MTGAAGCGVSFSPRAQRRDLLPSRRPGQSPARPNRHRRARLALAPMAALGGARRRPLLLLLFGERPGGGRGRGVRRRRGGRGGPAAGRAGPGGGGSGAPSVPGGPAAGGPGPAAAVRWRRRGFSALRFDRSPWGLRRPRKLRAAAAETRTARASVPAGHRAGGDPGPGSPSCGPAPGADLCSDAARPPGVLVGL